MTLTNDLENQIIKVLICLESKAGSETPLCLMMQAIKRKVVKPNKSKQPLHLIQCVSARICVCLCTYVCMCMCVCVCEQRGVSIYINKLMVIYRFTQIYCNIIEQ